MKRHEWAAIVAVLLILSAATYYGHYLLFHDAHHIFIYLVGDIGFMFLEVAMVTLVIDRLLHKRAQMAQEHKMNMVIGAFFSALGRELLHTLRPMVEDTETIASHISMRPNSSTADFKAAIKWVENTDFKVDASPELLEPVRNLLAEKRDFLLRLLENPVLLEHETFTDMLWSVSHFTDELCARKRLHELPDSDLQHIGADADRAFTRLIAQWVRYMQHLQSDYPYLYSFAVRANPLYVEEDVTVR